MKRQIILSLSLIAGLSACKEKSKNEKAVESLKTSYIDTTIKPGDDFYHFAVGNWIKNNPVPSTESRWGSFNEVEERNKIILHEILEDAQGKNRKNGQVWTQIGNFYESGMDSTNRNKRGIEPIKADIEAIKACKNWKDISALSGIWQQYGGSPFTNLFVEQDMKISSQMITYFYQIGLTLPEKGYYTKKDPETKAKQEAAKTFMKSLMPYLKDFYSDPVKAVNTIYGLEEKLAQVSRTRVELRNPEENYHKMPLKSFFALNPTFDWDLYLKKAMYPMVDSVVVGQPEFFKGMEQIMKKSTLEDWKLYMAYNLLVESAPYLSDELEKISFDFNQTAMRGVKEMKPRWERVMHTIEGSMGQALGKLFVEKTFKPEAKERMMKMVKSLQSVFRERIQKLSWMSEETKVKATDKLDKFLIKIGYPDLWRDYGTCKIEAGKYFENVMEASRFEFNRMVGKLGKPVDRSEWGMAPHVVNAYYNPSLNEIVFPAGILQPPFFDMNADDAVIYGAIGAVIGHEMTHGFDDEGSQFDANGNLQSWWTPEDRKKFEEKAKILINQFNDYTVLDSIHVNGELTLGENIADLGGLSIALDAFLRTEQGKKGEKIAGYTPTQRFFLSWANAWKNNITPDALKTRIMTDPHSPGMFRCNGPLSNMEEFFKAFGISQGNMFRPMDQRAIIW